MLAIIAICCSIMSFTVFATGEVVIENASSFASYEYGQQVELPTGSLKYGEESKNAKVSVTKPDGVEVLSGLLDLNVEGKYIVTYSADFNGTTKMAEASFMIKKPLFYVSSEQSSVVQYEYRYAEHATPEFASDRDGFDANSSVKGLRVNLAAGDVFEYSRVLDLKDKTSLDHIIDMVIAPNAIGVKDVSDFSIILTDAYDPNNYITVSVFFSSGVPLVYIRSAASKSEFCEGQIFTGWEFNRDVKHVNSAGTPARFSFTGPCQNTQSTDAFTTSASQNDAKYNINSIGDNNFCFSFDYYNKQAHAPDAPNGRKIAHASATTMLVDFDDPLHFDNVWGGFTTGECFLSIKGGAYETDSFGFMITSIMGVGDLTGDTINDTFEDRGSLNIELGLGEYEENNLPKALVGMEYPLFTSITKNVYFGTLYPEVEVKNPNGQTVTITDNAFTPTETGTYQLIYTVEDNIGNKNSKTVLVTAVASLEEIVIELADQANQPTITGVAGVFVDIPDFVGVNGSGICSIVKTVAYDGVPVAVENDKFFPEKSGDYTVTITATDYIGQTKNYSYTVTIDNGNDYVAITKPLLPKYFISGSTYTLPEVLFYDYTSGTGRTKTISSNVAYEDGNGVNIALGRKITPVAREDVNTVKITYYAGSYANMKGKLVYDEIPVIKVKELRDFTLGNGSVIQREVYKLDNLIYGQDFDKEVDSSATTLTFDNEINFDYVNPLIANELEIEFSGVKGFSSYEKVEITLTDSENVDQQVKFIYVARPTDNTRTDFYINDVNGLAYENSQAFASAGTIILTVNAFKANALYNVESTLAATIKTYLNGEKFEGFDSGKVYVNVAVKGVTERSQLKIMSIGGQPINAATTDKIAPVYAIDAEWLGYKTIGDKLLVPKAVIADAIDPSVVGTVTVRAPENENGVATIVTSIDGVYLDNVPCDRDYYVDLKLYGGYTVTFTAKDESGNAMRNAEEFIYVPDLEAPVITLSGKVPTSGKVGSKISLPNASATDALDGKCEVGVYMVANSGIYHSLAKDKWAFTPKSAGIYRIIYISQDASGNMAMNTYEINVK